MSRSMSACRADEGDSERSGRRHLGKISKSSAQAFAHRVPSESRGGTRRALRLLGDIFQTNEQHRRHRPAARKPAIRSAPRSLRSPVLHRRLRVGNTTTGIPGVLPGNHRQASTHSRRDAGLDNPQSPTPVFRVTKLTTPR